jgi:hypothetical protein
MMTTQDDRTPVSERPRPGQDQDELEAFVARTFAQCSDEHKSIHVFYAAHPVLTVRTLRAILRLPLVDVRLPRAGDREALARLLKEQRVGRVASLGATAVLQTPAEPGTYLDGSDRATVRRKVRSATKQGVEIRTVPQADRRHLLELADRNEQENEREEYRVAQPSNEDLLEYGLWLGAYDADGRPIMLAVIPYSGEFGILRYFRTLEPGRASSDARYLMTDAVAEELARRGVRYLIDTARPHWLQNGLRHFQRMVGFRLVRLRLRFDD